MKKVCFSLYCVFTIVLMLHSMNFFYFWNVHLAIPDLLCVFFGFLYLLISKKTKITLCRYGLLSLLFLFLGSCIKNNIIISIVHLMPIFFILQLTSEEKSYFLKWWTRSYCVILLVSFIAFLLAPIGLIPLLGVVDFGDNYSYFNYGLTLVSTRPEEFFRFNSLFLEPGHVGMISAFVLYANSFHLKKIINLIIFIVTLFTFSFAGYILLAIGYLLSNLSVGNRSVIKKIALSVIVIAIACVVAVNYNNGDNLFNTQIIERFSDDDRNYRFNENVDDSFDKLLNGDGLLFGMDSETYIRLVKDGDFRGAGYKLFILECGFIGTFLVLLGYFFMARIGNNRYYMYGMLILYILAFIQRAYPFWSVWMILFALSTYHMKNENEHTDSSMVSVG